MAIPSRGIGWGTEENLLWQISKQLERLTQVTGNSVSGSQTLAQTLVTGNNTGGNDILLNSTDAIQLENNSSLRKGTYDFGQGGGVSRICGVDYEDMWQGGIRHVFDSNGFIRNSTNGFNIIPNSSFDDTLRFKIGSFWTLDDGTTYECTDATTGAAVWQLYSTPPKYKVFTALLSQNGGDVPYSLINADNGSLIIGATYQITNYDATDNFLNVGAPSNTNGTSFIATGTTAQSWSGTTELNANNGAPVVDILENTIGNVWFEFGGADGVYQMRSDGLFSSYKTVGFITYNDGGSTGLNDKPSFSIYPSNDGNIYVNSALNGVLSNNVLFYAPFEIKVYN